MLIVCCMGGSTDEGQLLPFNVLLCFSKSLQVWKGEKRSHCKMTCHLASLSTLRTIYFLFLFFDLILFDSLLFLPPPGLAQDTSAARTVGPGSCPNRPESRPESATLPPPRPPHFGATTRLRPLPPLHHLYRPVLSEGLMSLAPPPQRLLPSSEPPQPRPLSPPSCPCLSKGPLPTNRTPQ